MNINIKIICHETIIYLHKQSNPLSKIEQRPDYDFRKFWLCIVIKFFPFIFAPGFYFLVLILLEC